MSDEELMRTIDDLAWALGNCPEETEAKRQFQIGILTGILITKGFGKTDEKFAILHAEFAAMLDRVRSARCRAEFGT